MNDDLQNPDGMGTDQVPSVDPNAAPPAEATAPVAPPEAPSAPPEQSPVEVPKTTRAPRKKAIQVQPGWYAYEGFKTQYSGVMLEFKAEQTIEDATMAQWLYDTGSPVEYREG